MRRSIVLFITLLVITPLLLGNSGCDSTVDTKSSSGVQKATVQVPTGSDGLTAEQRNIGDRLVEDNKIGSVKHLYVISAYSGQVLIYSTVRGKVTSGGKRLTPTSVVVGSQGEYKRAGFAVNFSGTEMATSEVLQDDGAYGHSMDYLYWWDTKGVYHQHYITGGQILHISNQPLAVKSIIINMEIAQKQE
ncbi:MAG: hypothetical protein A2934_04180 [Candidatus Sungbacteria bacterium RIFCSPLOWO2_01_FULL_47_10]|uniref:Lipoprotein n=1 Tax=Candidatus Sungbacteria bacterium RIFCSPLOWO2_01_FULL_47_10 TaxID=1802276 RepID=A0A1G2L421_9BACT|nr:MAG: hypothetical protein A2934_04180 [Candidatus Sungbacteria bacterium RIFCSPLOWO2_01_FULL_47_10]